jgi:general secretion pathway protein F
VPPFAYTATDAEGRTVSGQMDARDRAAVADRLHHLMLYPLEITQAEEGEARRALGFRWRRHRTVVFFTAQFATLLEAGLPVDRSLAILEQLTEEKRFAGIVGEVRHAVEEGSSLADALAAHPEWFEDLYVTMVRAGESGGALEIVMRRLAEFLDQSQKTRDFILSSLAYPLFLIFFSAASLAVIFVFVLPRFARIFDDLGEALPLPARVLMTASDLIAAWWWAALIGLAAAALLLRAWLATADGRLAWDRNRLEWPLLGNLTRKLETARFARTLGTLLSGGVPILQAVEIVGATVGNRHMAGFMRDIGGGLKKGEGLAAPLKRTGIFPPLFIHMATVGEETGQIEEMLVRTAGIFEREVESATKGLLSLLEPIILVVLGLLLGGVIISILWAIFSVYSISF